MKLNVKNIKTSIFILLFFSFHNLINAQDCLLSVDVVPQNSTCIGGNGSIKVTLSGNDIDLSKVSIRLINNDDQSETFSSENGHQFEKLFHGNYTIIAESYCKSTNKKVSKTIVETISLDYTNLYVSDPPGVRNSLNCINSGVIDINILNGRSPYKIEIISKPNDYTGETSFVVDNPGWIQFDKLPPGDYKFVVSDCSYEKTIMATVDKLPSDFPSDPFEDYFFPAGCNQAYVYPIYYNGTNIYWDSDSFREEFYEIAFSFDGATKNYIPASYSYPQYVDLPELYKDLCADKAKVKVYIRLKDTNCEQLVDEIQFYELSAEIYLYDERSCENYKLNFYLNNESILCPPFSWAIFDDKNVIIDSQNNITPSFGVQTSQVSLSYGKEYTLQITDNNESVVKFNNILSERNLFVSEVKKDRLLLTYSLHYNVSDQFCLPYKIELYEEETNKLVMTVDNMNDYSGSIKGLDYNKNYKIVVIDKSSDNASIDFSEPRPEDIYIGEGGEPNIVYVCDNYTIRIEKPITIKTPYTWSVSGNGFSSSGTEDKDNTTISGLKYGVGEGYIVQFKDNDNNTASYVIPANINPPAPEFDYSIVKQCDEYDAQFNVRNIFCLPYNFKISYGDDNIFNEQGTESLSHNVKLEYNKEYTITITDSKSSYNFPPLIIEEDNVDIPILGYPNILGNTQPCSYDSYLGCMQIYGQDGQSIKSGTKIHFVSGPQTPVHTDVTLEEDISIFYPFSTNYHDLEFVSVLKGTYIFEVTDPCGKSHSLEIVYKKDLDVINFSYKSEIVDECKGISRIYPLITGNTNYNSIWFTIIEGPDPDLFLYTIYGDPLNYFELKIPGKYVIEIREYPYSECGIDTIVINYASNDLIIIGKPSSYVCGSNDDEHINDGHIRVQAGKGKPPYTYTLFEDKNGALVEVESNDTGAFDYGTFGKKYTIKVTDNCKACETCEDPKTTVPVEFVIGTLDNISLINDAKTNVCKYENIELSCSVLGATEYEWTGPLGFKKDISSIVISNLTAEHSGMYKVKVKPYGCDNYYLDSIEITVHDVPKPAVPDDGIVLCQEATSNPLSIETEDGYSIQWYDAGKNPLAEAPIIDRSNFNTYVYYVTQTETSSACISEIQQINVKVNPKPEKQATATAWSCDGYPEITITNMVEGYYYTVFDNDDPINALINFRATKEDTLIKSPQQITSSSLYIRTDREGCAISPDKSVPIDMIKISPAPEELPIYTNGVPYYVQLISDTENPVFSIHTGELVPGLSLDPSGIISGIPESEDRIEPKFIVEVTELKTGCKGFQKYTLRTCEPPPALISETTYCQGVKSSPLQILTSENCVPQWYDANKKRLDEAPIPATSNTGEQIFYVSQKNEQLNCESDMTEIKILVTPAPEIDFKASVNPVCLGNASLILLENLNENNAYIVYSDNALINKIGETTGVTSDVITLQDTPQNSTTYYVLTTDNLGCTSINQKETPVEVIKLYIEPEQLPQYYKNVDYEQQLTTNALSPMFSIIDGELPNGLSLNASGLLYGRALYSDHDISNIFTVKLYDLNTGCNITQEYILNDDIFVPKIFTPNNDGINDLFMLGYEIIVFDRLGVEIFNGNNGWDGKYKGKPVDSDIYFYKLKYSDDNDSKKTITGYVGVHY
jgi:gliding motility-associated-like protein